jgi:hypothetical protein
VVEHEKRWSVNQQRAGVSRSLYASLSAMLIVLFASALAAVQSGAETAWKFDVASGAASVPIARSRADALIAEAAAPLTVAEPSADRATTAGASKLVARPPDLDGAQPGTVENPPADSAGGLRQQPPSSALESQQSDDDGSDVAQYREDQREQLESEGEFSTPFGMQLREARRTLNSGEQADGLLITAVEKDSPAAAVGLRAYNHRVHDALTGVAIAGAVVLLMVPGGQFAYLLIPMLDSMHVGESYDMIIGVDGMRVMNFLDFQDRMTDLQPGEVIYLSVVRNGKRVQVTMPVPANAVRATN